MENRRVAELVGEIDVGAKVGDENVNLRVDATQFEPTIVASLAYQIQMTHRGG